jgi:ligand-binding sensor domain-containing protein/two-component sensor histidine kinase
MLKSAAKFPRASIAMVVLALILFCCVFRGTAGDYMIRTLEVDDGLPVSTVTDVAQTPDGYLWIGTLLGGLARYDGVKFDIYGMLNTPELKNASARRLCVDSEGVLWVATYGSLVRWHDGVFTLEMEHDSKVEALLFSDEQQVVFVTTDHGLLMGRKNAEGGYAWTSLTPPGTDYTPQFCADKDGVIWYRHRDGSLWWVRDGRAEPVKDNGLTGKINALVADSQGRIWAGTDRGIFSWDGTRFQNDSPTNGESILVVRRLFFCRDNSLWVEANGRFRRCRDRQWDAEAKSTDADVPQGSRLQFIRDDGEGGLWLTSSDSGLTHLAANGVVSRSGAEENYTGSVVRCLFVDNERNLWVGYERRGLVKIRQRFFQIVGRAEGLADSVVSSVCEGADGSLWMGTVGGSLGRWQNGVCTNLTLPQSGSRRRVAIVNSDGQGRVWVAAGNGLFVLDGGEFRQLLPPDELKADVRLLLPTHDGTVWLAGQTILYAYAHDELTKIREAQMPRDNFAALAEASDGTLWIGTTGGELLNYDGKKFQSFRPPPDVPSARLWAFCAETNGTLWIGTSANGLLRFRNGSFHYFSPANGLPSQAISQVLDDHLGGLWIGTRAGISRIAKEELDRCGRGELAVVACRTFGRSDGLRTIACASEFQPLCVRASDGRLWFAMANGVASVQPETVTPNRFVPPVLIEAVLLDGKNIMPQTGLTRAGGKTVLKIPPGQHDLEFRFTGISFSSPEGVRLRYQLVGLDKEWQTAGANRSVTYRYLPPGEYTFHVSACNSGGVWNDAAPVGIVLTPFLWQRAWFPWATVTAVATLITTGLVIWLRTRHRRKLQLQFERLERQRAVEKERTRVAQDLHDDLGAGLTEIGLLSGMLQNNTTLPPENKGEALSRISQRTRYLVTALDEIVWAVNPRNDSAKSLGGYFCRYAQEFFEPTSIRCRLELREGGVDSPLNSEQRHHLFLAFKETLTNVVRHSGASEVRVSISLEAANRLTISVQDNGHGLPQILAEGADGLINLRQRMTQLRGDCKVHNLPEGGAEVKLSVPLSATSEKIKTNL